MQEDTQGSTIESPGALATLVGALHLRSNFPLRVLVDSWQVLPTTVDIEGVNTHYGVKLGRPERYPCSISLVLFKSVPTQA